MKLFWKTMGWAAISGAIFFFSAIATSCPWQSAVFATFVAVVSKTPAYPVWEMVFERLWNKRKDRGCTKVIVDKTPVLAGETV